MQHRQRLETIYGPRAEEALTAIERAMADMKARLPGQPSSERNTRWDERDIVLITYANQLRAEEIGGAPPPLEVLRDWLLREGLDGLINTIHLLPFCPYSSDDGFSVIDYLAVDPDAGSWDDIARLGVDFELMFDLVLNHISQHSEWFAAYKRGEGPYAKFFIEADPSLDLSQVVRPRSLPLLTPVDTDSGEKHVWTTFSADQIDLNYAEPRVLAEMLRILLEYAARGARIVRLDAVAFLWKEIGTNCLHLPETHEIVKLCRDVLAEHAPQTLVLTETNVPHAENVSYFGAVDRDRQEGDEAHMVYNFSLPPLLLDAFINGDAVALKAWLENLTPPPPGCAFFNFTASHDGIGVRPLEGLVSPERFDRMIEAVRLRGGKINTRRAADGRDVPYELNITYVDALAPNEPDIDLHARRFLTSQAVMLAFRGMPAIYFHSLVGTQNDYAGAEESGQNRRINRHKYTLTELDAHLAKVDSLQRRIYDGYRELLAMRIAQPAFHPDAGQEIVDLGNHAILAFKRTSLDGLHTVLVAANFSSDEQALELPEEWTAGLDLRAQQPWDGAKLSAGEFLYLSQGAA